MLSIDLHGGMHLRHFDFVQPALVNFVGAGGKTALILALLEEAGQNCSVVYTTTTRIHPPRLKGGLAIVSCDGDSLLRLLIARLAAFSRRCKGSWVITRPGTQPGFLRGLNPEYGKIFDRRSFPLILNEADGARSMSLKFPRPGEPVLMEGANYLVPVIGLDCLNKPMGPDVLFRWELAERHLKLQPGHRITPSLAAEVLLHPDGVCKDWEPGVQIIPYINKVDTPEDDAQARELAHALLQNCNFPVGKVIWGSVLRSRADSLAAKRQ